MILFLQENTQRQCQKRPDFSSRDSFFPSFLII